MIRVFKVVKGIANMVLTSAEEGERLYLKGSGLYNDKNQRICDMDSEVAKECTEEIYVDKVAKCIRGFSVREVDDDGFFIENSDIIVEVGTIWAIEEDAFRVIGGEVRLTSDELGWLEIDHETFGECFDVIN